MRNHNLIAGELQKEHPRWTDEQLYQEARKINIAEYQEIIYNAVSARPARAAARCRRTRATTRTSIPPSPPSSPPWPSGSATALLSGEIERQGNNGQDVLPDDPAGADISLATDFFDPNVLNPSGVVDPLTGHISTDIGPILKADADGVVAGRRLDGDRRRPQPPLRQRRPRKTTART